MSIDNQTPSSIESDIHCTLIISVLSGEGLASSRVTLRTWEWPGDEAREGSLLL
jgi:hypothetical protein